MNSGPNKISAQTTDPFYNLYYNALFNELYTPLCRFSMKFVADKNAAEDIVQDLFLYLWENWSRLSGISSLKSYAYTAVRNRSLSYLQKQFAHAENQGPIKNEEKVVDSMVQSPQDLMEFRELEEILEGALQSLPVKCRTIFTMKRFGELTHKEVAEKLNISEKTVEAQITIAIRKLRAFISDHWELMLLILIDRMQLFF
jgi:RNA polymerase sigma-70 factor, ECF subfamily